MSIAAVVPQAFTAPLPLATDPSGTPGDPTGPGGGGTVGGGPKPPCDHNGPHGTTGHRETGSHKRRQREAAERAHDQREANQCAIRGNDYINGRCVPDAKIGSH